MALRVWNGGAGNGNLLDAGNYVGGVAPVATDSILINDTDRDINGVTAGFAIADFIVGSKYRGTIGADGVPVIFTNITGTFKYGGSGAGIRIGCSGTFTAVDLSHTQGMVWITGGTITAGINGSGNVNIAAAVALVGFENLSGDVVIGPNATAITNLINMGNLTYQRDATTCKAKRGRTVQQDSGTTRTKVATLLEIENGAVYNKQSGGTETGIVVFPGGLFTCEQNSGGATGTVDLGTITKYAGSRTKTTQVPGAAFTVAFSYKGAQAGVDAA